jgi:hypothetical protein
MREANHLPSPNAGVKTREYIFYTPVGLRSLGPDWARGYYFHIFLNKD